MLHRLELPPEAAHLRWAVGLQERLLRALCDPATTPATVTVGWVQGLWHDTPAKWVRSFCSRKALGLMKTIAAAMATEKTAVLNGFRNDCQAGRAFAAGAAGFRFQGLNCCGDNMQLSLALKELFMRFYDPGFDAGAGFAAPGVGSRDDRLDRPAFVAAFARHNDLGVCPYCDGPLVPALAKVDHFYPKSAFPFLAIAPENLVPACTDCNSIQVKGARAPLALGAANEVADWFHPYHRTADGQFRVEFLAPRANDQPRQLRLTAAAPPDQPRVDNLDALFGVADLWADRLKHRMKGRIQALRTRRRKQGRVLSETELRGQCSDWAEEARAGRRHAEFAILEEAWCLAAAQGDAQFMEELAAVNTESP